MSKCRCCTTPKAGVMAPLCDRCFLGWNGDCCDFRIALDQAIADSSDHTCRDLGFYEVPFGLQIKRMNAKNKLEKELNEKIKIVCKNDHSHVGSLAS